MTQAVIPHEEPSGSLSDQQKTVIIPVIEEELEIERTKRAVSAVRLTKTVTAREERIEASNTVSKVSVERVEINQVFDSPPAIRQESGVTIYPVVEEVLVVVTKYLLKEEIRVSRQETSEPRAGSVLLRREKVEIDRRELNADEPFETPNQILEPFSEGTMEWIETAEQAVVLKRARVVEEVILNKESREHIETVTQTVRKTEITTEDFGPELD